MTNELLFLPRQCPLCRSRPAGAALRHRRLPHLPEPRQCLLRRADGRVRQIPDQFGFCIPDLMAPLSVYAQFLAGIAFILGLFTRWAGLITCFNFIVAVWMVHWNDPVPGIWPAARPGCPRPLFRPARRRRLRRWTHCSKRRALSGAADPLAKPVGEFFFG